MQAMAGRSQSTASAADLAYHDDLDARIIGAHRAGRSTFAAFVEAAGGAHPIVVHRRLSSLGISAERLSGPGTPDERRPHLHPLDFEWYFTADCAMSLARSPLLTATPVLCMGVPTVAAQLASAGHEAVLLDRNPLVADRVFPAAAGLEIRHQAVGEPVHDAGAFGTVILDAPWYPEDGHRWLAEASRLVQLGGTIVFVLPPALLRPGAAAEREDLLELARSLGRTRVIGDAATYQTPLFEWEAMIAARCPPLDRWRRADLAVVEDVEHRLPAPVPAPASAPFDLHDTWVIGPQVVKLRKGSTGQHGEIVSQVPGLDGWVYDSVSRRDPRRKWIDLWTSRNRVARVGDEFAVRRVLDALASDEAALSADPDARALRQVLYG